MPVADCPDAIVLKDFLLGHTSQVEALALERHLAQCPACLATADGLRSQDTLCEAVRGCLRESEVVEEPTVAQLIERLQSSSLSHAAGQAIAELEGQTANKLTVTVPRSEQLIETPTSPPDSGTPGSQLNELFAFFAPQGAAGEIGGLGQYRLLRLLGAGGMGAVFLAHDAHLERKVALKVMLPRLAASSSARERFQREAKAAAAIEHEHIVHIYQVGEDHGIPFLAMQYLHGETLEERLNREGRLPLGESLRIARQIAEGLSAAHSRKLIHRDIKPGNVFLEVRSGECGMESEERETMTDAHSAPRIAPSALDRVKLLDFGLARATAESASLTQQGVIVGTPAYMAPEQAAGRTVDSRADLFSLGCVLYQMTTGERPFQGKDTLTVLSRLANHTPRPPHELNPAVPKRLSQLVVQLLEKDPAKRPASARLVVEALAEIERSPELHGPAIRPQATQARIRFTGALGMAVVLLIGLMPLAYFFGPNVVRYVSNQGQLVVETDDDSVEVILNKSGLRIHDKISGREYVLRPGRNDLPAGKYQIEVTEKASGLKLLTDEFTLTRGGRVPVRVTFERPAIAKKAEPPRMTVVRRTFWAGRNIYFTAFSPDSRLLLVTGDVPSGPTARVIDVETGRIVAEVPGCEGGCFTPDSKQVLLADSDKNLRLYDVATGNVVRAIATGHTNWLTAPQLSPDGKLAASASNDHVVQLWDLQSGSRILKIEDHTGPSYARFAADGKHLITFALGDRVIRLWDVTTRKQVRSWSHPGAPMSVWIPAVAGGNQFITLGQDEFLRWWAFDQEREVRSMKIEPGNVAGNGLSPDGRWLLYGAKNDNRLHLLDLATDKEIDAIAWAADWPAAGPSFSPDGRYAAAAEWGGGLYLWRLPEPIADRPGG